MKKYPSPSLFLLIAILCLFAGIARAQTTGTWTNADDRDYDGQGHFIAAFWSYGYVPPPNSHVGNWSGVAYPGSGGVTNAILDAPGNTLCDVNVSLNSLTIKAGGLLIMQFSSALAVATTDIQADGTVNLGAGGGPFPSFTNTGTLTKSGGTGSFIFDPSIVFNSSAGSTIKVTSGTLVLPGDADNFNGTLDSVTFSPAAGATIVLMNLNTTQTVKEHAQGTLGGSTGTVLLEGGVLQGGQSPCTLDFTGNVFQWTGGTIGQYQQGSTFSNTGTITISGTDPKETDANFTNKGTIIQNSSVGLNVGDYNSGGSFTNAAGAVYDMQTNAGIGQSGYPFYNKGLLKKSGGTGVSTLTCAFYNQGGTVEVDSGTVQLPLNMGSNQIFSTGGTFKAIAATAVLDLGDANHFIGTYKGSGAGHVRLSQGSLFTDNQTGATFNFPGAIFQWTGGAIGGFQGGHLFTNTGTINLMGANDKQTYANPFANKGTMILTGTGNFNIGGANGGGTFNNDVGGTFKLASNASLIGTFDSLNNSGLFEKTAGAGT
ncbi:MAG: hypothetical protein ACRD5Z_21985, partial [Bryobacteraceae bacterium]